MKINTWEYKNWLQSNPNNWGFNYTHLHEYYPKVRWKKKNERKEKNKERTFLHKGRIFTQQSMTSTKGRTHKHDLHKRAHILKNLHFNKNLPKLKKIGIKKILMLCNSTFILFQFKLKFFGLKQIPPLWLTLSFLISYSKLPFNPISIPTK